MKTEKNTSSLSVSEIRRMARSGRLGNLKLLALSLAILLLCVVGLVLMQDRSTDSPPAAVTRTTDVVQAPAAETFEGTVEAEQLGVSGGATPTQHEAGGTAPVARTPEDRERLYEEMGQQIPPGQVLTY
jgi:hypothetical protein